MALGRRAGCIAGILVAVGVITCAAAVGRARAQRFDEMAGQPSGEVALSGDMPKGSLDLLEDAGDELLDHLYLMLAIATQPKKIGLLLTDYAAVLEDATGVRELGALLRNIGDKVYFSDNSPFAVLVEEASSPSTGDAMERAMESLNNSLVNPPSDAQLKADDKDPKLVRRYRMLVKAISNDLNKAIQNGLDSGLAMPDILLDALQNPSALIEKFEQVYDSVLYGEGFVTTRHAATGFLDYLLDHPPASFVKMADDVIAMEDELESIQVGVEQPDLQVLTSFVASIQSGKLPLSEDLIPLVQALELKLPDNSGSPSTVPQGTGVTVVADLTESPTGSFDLGTMLDCVFTLILTPQHEIEKFRSNDPELSKKVQNTAKLFAQFLDHVTEPSEEAVTAADDLNQILDLDAIVKKTRTVAAL